MPDRQAARMAALNMEITPADEEGEGMGRDGAKGREREGGQGGRREGRREGEAGGKKKKTYALAFAGRVIEVVAPLGRSRRHHYHRPAYSKCSSCEFTAPVFSSIPGVRPRTPNSTLVGFEPLTYRTVATSVIPLGHAESEAGGNHSRSSQGQPSPAQAQHPRPRRRTQLPQQQPQSSRARWRQRNRKPRRRRREDAA